MALEGPHHITAITADAPLELATRDIGFAADEPAASLGEELKLPAQYESRREQLERALTPITNPRAAA